ncbi:MAG: alanine dehydrogenase [Chitinophagaceae bacterium]|nr:alanine dehydrogenase [Chitinophagaceae bacterium]
MLKIGLIKEGKYPPDNRVALTPAQCKWIHQKSDQLRVVVESCKTRCFGDREYGMAGIDVVTDVSDCDILLGIKEVPIARLIAGKIYLFFSHTKKMQPYNKALLQAILKHNITLIDYECLEHEDGQRILGFGFFAGVVGAHNGMMAYGKRSGSFHLQRVYEQKNFKELIHTYFGLKVPPIKIAVTGSGRVAGGILEIMNLLGVIEVEPEEFLARKFSYPVFTHLKGPHLYKHKQHGTYNREDFHLYPENYSSSFYPYTTHTDILINGIYWNNKAPRLFEWEHLKNPQFSICTIADITDDLDGSVPCNLGDATIEEPIYGVDRDARIKTAPYLPTGIDIMAVGNLPNELPRDASQYFGEQLIKYVLEDLVNGGSEIIDRATMVRNGRLTERFSYLSEYAGLL